MKYSYKSQLKSLDYLVVNEPHNLESFKKLYFKKTLSMKKVIK